MYIDRLGDASTLFGTGGVPDRPAPATTDGKPTPEQAVALTAASEVFVNQFLPSIRAWIAFAVESAKRGRLTSDAFARYAELMRQAGKPVGDGLSFSEWEAAVKVLCRSLVTAKLLDRRDSIFDGFDF